MPLKHLSFNLNDRGDIQEFIIDNIDYIDNIDIIDIIDIIGNKDRGVKCPFFMFNGKKWEIWIQNKGYKQSQHHYWLRPIFVSRKHSARRQASKEDL